MKKIISILVILIVVVGIILLYFMLTHGNEKNEVNENKEESTNEPTNEEEENNSVEKEEKERIRLSVSDGNHTIIFELNDSDAAISLYNQLPLEMEVQNFSSNEKIFYPPEKLDISNTPTASGGRGVLAYYAPWSDVVMFYDSFNENSNLYELGYAIEGENAIENLNGNLTIEKIEN